MKLRILLVICLILGATATLLADKWAAPTPRIFGSSWGNYGFKLLKPEFDGASEGVLFRLDAEGQEKIVWQARLVNTPHQVIVDDDGSFVVTIDTYGRLGFAHALVVYGEKGKVIRDFKLEDLLSEKEIAAHVERTVSSRHWTNKASFQIEGGHLVGRLEWGKTLRIELSTGKLAASDPQGDDTRIAGVVAWTRVSTD